MSNCDCNQGRLPCSCKQNDTQSELAALREELANTTSVAKSEIEGLSLALQASQQRLAAAEQRNSELVELLTEHQWDWEQYDSHSHREGGYYCVECQEPKASGHEAGCKLAAALKPTESGASEAERKEDDEALQRRHDQERQEYFSDDR